MLITFKDFPNIFVFVQGEKNPIGQLLDCILDKKTGTFPAFWIRTKAGTQILPTTDILRWEGKKILIQDQDALVHPKKIIRLKHLLEKDIPLLQSPVWDKNTLLGTVRNFSFDTISPRLIHLYSKKGWWMFSKHFLIHSSRIEQITNKGIYLLDNIPKEELKKDIEKKLKRKKVAPVQQIKEKY